MLTKQLNMIKEKQNESLNMSQMMLSHEFRSPLTSTLMLLETLLNCTVLESAR